MMSGLIRTVRTVDVGFSTMHEHACDATLKGFPRTLPSWTFNGGGARGTRSSPRFTRAAAPYVTVLVKYLLHIWL
jgi:hypothetical protein